MTRVELIAPCHFGLEAVLKKEIYDLGYDIVKVEDGRVTFEGDMETICRANVFLRTAERILLKVGEFKAYSFDDLFEGIKAIEWENYIPKDGKVWVKKASSVKSKLISAPDIQSITKKSIAERLCGKYGVGRLEESGEEYPLRIFIMKDTVTVGLDTTGVPLHKRGYRQLTSKAPIKETLAAALIMLTPWHKDRILVDPFCGSGTFPIEAAMMAANIAPGMNREFTAENWSNIVKRKYWYDTITEANDLLDLDVDVDIQGYDIDGTIIKCAMENAKEASVDKLIHFQKRPVSELSHPKKYGFIITNPPYGERLEEREALPELYTQIGERYQSLDAWSAFIITSYEDAEKYIGLKATKNRKIYNGMLKTYYYQFLGPKPPRMKSSDRDEI